MWCVGRPIGAATEVTAKSQRRYHDPATARSPEGCPRRRAARGKGPEIHVVVDLTLFPVACRMHAVLLDSDLKLGSVEGRATIT